MYKQVWNKYLPIIRILVKRSAASEQTLVMNATDFERASGGRKAACKFSIVFSNGRLEDSINSSLVAKDFASVLLQDAVLKDLFTQSDYSVDLTSKYQLVIRHVSKTALEETAVETDALVETVD